ncbi:cytochrome P450 [Streptodolium elevatio]|uniref:Cytochrome P450 n=1 Tax=Streptodolium elevatio TaxID=3157996 RepID=A0ABV3DV74_9ACTN
MTVGRPILDRSASALAKGYAWLPDLRRRNPGPLLRTRVLGRQAAALRGPEAVRFFYDEDHVRRAGAMPEPVLSTLFGHGAVHTLDGPAHRQRKDMFLSLLTEPREVAELARHAAECWDDAVEAWAERPSVVLFDEVPRVLTRAVCAWAAVPLGPDDTDRLASDLVAMVDGFGTAGPRHWRARAVRKRRERWLEDLVERVRSGHATVPTGSVVDVIAKHRDVDGRPLDRHTAAVELLNVIRPTVAISWFIAYAGHALHRWPHLRKRLRHDDTPYAVAFAHELRRFYPFAPYLGGLAATDLRWQDEDIPADTMVLLDVYGQHHSDELWDQPYAFDPDRFLDVPPGRDELIPQGGGDRSTGHRCPGEDITVALLATLVPRLARLDYDVPDQDLRISLRRLPARIRSGFVLEMACSGALRDPVDA